ncbi:hypothetical protein ACPFP2_11145 [Micromonospora citrea]|uniref:hypothetical protein n=1 Tax=Micromonospora citrea TaxID=47855 RepID=UPI003C679EE5
MRKTTGKIVAASLLAAAGVLVQVAPAQAATVDVWQNASYTGGYRGMGETQSTYHGYYFNNGTRLWDAVTSLKNHANNWTTFWTGHFCTGSGFSVEPDASGGDRANVGTKFNDTFSSHAPEWMRNGC